MKTLLELKDKLAKLKVGERIPAIYLVREKITKPHNSGEWTVSYSLSIEKDKSFPLRIEKYYFVGSLCNDYEIVLEHAAKVLGRKRDENGIRQGFSLEEIYAFLDSFPNGMIPGSRQDVWYGHYVSEDEANKKCQELMKPYKIAQLEQKIKDIEDGYKNLDNLKQMLFDLKNDK